eukprot:364809-Chlamydomonas_euryale.AAC.9
MAEGPVGCVTKGPSRFGVSFCLPQAYRVLSQHQQQPPPTPTATTAHTTVGARGRGDTVEMLGPGVSSSLSQDM